MTLTNISPGDVVQIDHKGRVFFALAGERVGRELRLKPLPTSTNGLPWYSATGADVIGHWRASTATRRRMGLA